MNPVVLDQIVRQQEEIASLDKQNNELADRIKELEREDAAWRKLNEQADKTVDRAEQERDALQADNARLRGKLAYAELILSKEYNHVVPSIVKALAATPEQSLARIRNQVKDECAKVCESQTEGFAATSVWDEAALSCARAIRAMKEAQ